MEAAAIQAMCGVSDATKHLYRIVDGQSQAAQHDAGHFEIAFSLAAYVTGNEIQVYETVPETVLIKEKF